MGRFSRGFYTAYCEYFRLADAEIDRSLQQGPELISANFVIPCPLRFPIMVPGQVLTKETIDFIRKLDVNVHRRTEAGPSRGAYRALGFGTEIEASRLTGQTTDKTAAE